MVATPDFQDSGILLVFQPLLTKKDGCDLLLYLKSAADFFQPLLTKKDGCDGSWKSVVLQKDLRRVDRELGQSYFPH
jgi:hypothetical protein